MRIYCVIIVLLSLFYSVSSVSEAQEKPKEYVRIVLIDDSELIGTITNEDSIMVEIVTMSGLELTLKRTQISAIKKVTGKAIDGQYFPDDPNRTRLLFAPTGKSLRAGQGYAALYELVFPFIGYGVGDFLTLSGGMTLFPGAETQILYLAPKATIIERENYSAATGIIHFTPTSSAITGENRIGIVYGVGTYSGEKVEVTGGLGWAYAGKDIVDKPIIMGAVELRTSRYMKVIAEGWFPPDVKAAILGGGVRFFGTNFAADLGVIYLAATDVNVFIPWVSLVYNFGNLAP